MSDVMLKINQLSEISDHGYGFRFLATLAAGVFVAGSLTMFMHALIKASHKELDESARVNMLDFVRVKRDESSARKKLKPTRPEVDKTPPAPPTPQANEASSSNTNINIAMPSVSDVNVEVGALGVNSSDGNYLPIVKVAPAYPVKAAMDGIEGSCTVEYTVTVTGATRDVALVPGECERVFARASIAAAKKFKYKPKVVSGEAIEVPGVRNRFDFKLHKNQESQ